MISLEEKVILKETADLLRDLRNKKKLSQKQLAFEIGISRTQYQAIERGIANFGVLTLYKLAEILEIDPRQLLINSPFANPENCSPLQEIDLSRLKMGSTRQKMRSTCQKNRSTCQKNRSTRQKMRSTRQKMRSTRQKMRSTSQKIR